MAGNSLYKRPNRVMLGLRDSGSSLSSLCLNYLSRDLHLSKRTGGAQGTRWLGSAGDIEKHSVSSRIGLDYNHELTLELQ